MVPMAPRLKRDDTRLWLGARCRREVSSGLNRRNGAVAPCRRRGSHRHTRRHAIMPEDRLLRYEVMVGLGDSARVRVLVGYASKLRHEQADEGCREGSCANCQPHIDASCRVPNSESSILRHLLLGRKRTGLWASQRAAFRICLAILGPPSGFVRLPGINPSSMLDQLVGNRAGTLCLMHAGVGEA